MSLSKEGSSPRSLLGLPSELVLQVIGHLDAVALIRFSGTCKTVQAITNDDKLWEPIVNRNLKRPLATPSPCNSFRELYIAHHPNWFLLQNRIWFADCDPNGKLIISRFDAASGSIVATQITASRGPATVTRWEKSDSVIIHTFHPTIGIDTYQPIVRLDMDSPKEDTTVSMHYNVKSTTKGSAYGREIMMRTFEQPGLHSTFMLCRALPDASITQQTQVWPPLLIPSRARARNESLDNFQSLGHRPSCLDEVCEYIFRVRKWAQYSEGSSEYVDPFAPYASPQGMTIRVPEDINTFATLPESCYTPTPEKPYQGIFCGDYSGHGCEFLLITQPDAETARPLPEGTGWLRRWFQGQNRYSVASSSGSSSYASAQETPDSDEEDISFAEAAQRQIQRLGRLEGYPVPLPSIAIPDPPDHASLTDYPDVPTGRLEAIKLTGDPNIPRGEYTFIAPDLGHRGFVRVADEAMFRGARVVRSTGHIAGTGFRLDEYSPSELILISHDVLAQFWHGSNHISFYKRVDLDALEEMPI